MNKIKKFLKTEIVLILSFFAALCTSFFVPITLQYLNYIDFKVLAILFCLMVIVAGLKDIGIFNVLAERMTSGANNTRGLFLSLILICFFSSMLITNDVALITFVPFSLLVLNITGQTDKMIFVTVMQTVAANLGSMLTPVGNPQNLYLFSYYNIGMFEFFKITVPVTLAGFVLIFILSVAGKHEQIFVQFKLKEQIKNKHILLVYLILFTLSIMAVFRLFNYIYVLIIVITIVFFLDKRLFFRVDYSLLATFIFFFIFTGNIGSLNNLTNFFIKLIKGHELIYSVIISQVISNVPAAVLLSNFTENYKALLIGTNVGGLGTLVASLASLISYKLYVKTENSKPSKYLLMFTTVNISMLLILLIFSSFLI